MRGPRAPGGPAPRRRGALQQRGAALRRNLWRRRGLRPRGDVRAGARRGAGPRRRDAELCVLPGAARRPPRRGPRPAARRRGVRSGRRRLRRGGHPGHGRVALPAARAARRGRAGALRAIIEAARGPRRRPGAAGDPGGFALFGGKHAHRLALPGLRVLPPREAAGAVVCCRWRVTKWRRAVLCQGASCQAARRGRRRVRRQHVARAALRQRLQGPAGEIWRSPGAGHRRARGPGHGLHRFCHRRRCVCRLHPVRRHGRGGKCD